MAERQCFSRFRFHSSPLASAKLDLTCLTPAQRTALGLTPFDAINFFTNAVDLKTRGIEAVADYRTRAWGGALGLNAAYSYAKNSIRGVATRRANSPSSASPAA